MELNFLLCALEIFGLLYLVGHGGRGTKRPICGVSRDCKPSHVTIGMYAVMIGAVLTCIGALFFRSWMTSKSTNMLVFLSYCLFALMWLRIYGATVLKTEAMKAKSAAHRVANRRVL